MSYLLNFQDSHLLFFLSFILFTIFIFKWLLSNKLNKNLHLPPSPPKIPIIGHLHQLGNLLHRSLRLISNKHGKLILLYLGHKPTLVVSSSIHAQEIMKTHDLIFSNRPTLRFVNRIFYDGSDIAFNSYCSKWKYMKSICVLQLLSKKKVKSFRGIRETEVALLIENIKGNYGSVVNLNESFMTLTSDIISMVALGRKYTQEDGNSANLYRLFKELMEVLGAVSIGDYIPMLGWIDRLSGLESRAEFVRKKFDDFMEEVVQQHQTRLKDYSDDSPEDVRDFVDLLLQIQREKPDQLSRDDIKAIIMDMYNAGTETSSTTLEWTMLELLRNPTIMRNLQAELRNIVGINSTVTEDDLDHMKYLDAVIKETLRLHPPIPLLLFRECYEDVKIDNYDIPARTQVIINAWAIQRDPIFWKDPEDFIPERFLNNFSHFDFSGQHFDYIPFGGGRRGCPGVSYGTMNAKFIIASLIYEFKWTLPNGRDVTSLDVEESAGITIRPLNLLNVIASPSCL